MDCLSSEDLKEEKTSFALSNSVCRILGLSRRKCPRSGRVYAFVATDIASWYGRENCVGGLKSYSAFP